MRYRDTVCEKERRRSKDGVLGIDYIEVFSESLKSQRSLHVHFLKDMVPEELVGRPDSIKIEGGVRITGIEAIASRKVENYLLVEVDKAGDFSIYTMVIEDIEGLVLDRLYSRCEFSFKGGCPSRLDCQSSPYTEPESRVKPLIDYNAKDYASFRRALLDWASVLIPDWKEVHEADFGIVLLELLAYAGDQLSYYQDVVANEAFLETARQRVSVRRHVNLIDYRMHDGASARVFVYFKVMAPLLLLKETQLLTHIGRPLGNLTDPPGTRIPIDLKEEALRAADAVFESTHDVQLSPELNKIQIHTWGNEECCLPKGSTTADLVGDLTMKLHQGDFLLFEEIRSPDSGLEEEANLAHRQVVRLTSVERVEDNFSDELSDPAVTTVEWNRADALTFPLCISSKKVKGQIGVARGNLVIADHGRRICEVHQGPKAPRYKRQWRAHRVHLKEGPLSFSLENAEDALVSALMSTDPHLGVAQVKAKVGSSSLDWLPARSNLLSYGPFDRSFAVEVDNVGRAVIRFGDGQHGLAVSDGSPIDVTYRVGVGRAGNIGYRSLKHAVQPEGIDYSNIESLYNPLPAWGGVNPEPMERVKLLAPAAFHADRLRAVTEEDYAFIAEKHPEVSKAVATFRWTGSWHTVFITIDPVGTNEVSSHLRSRIKDWVARYSLAGYDIDIDQPIFVPLEIEVDLCIEADHFKGDVELEVSEALSNRSLPDGNLGFFHPDKFTFGQTLYLSQLYAAIESVEGVESASFKVFKCFGRDPEGELEKGYISANRMEVIRLDNDPSFPENGVLRLNSWGGR
jgi:hypothetical protein